MGDAADGYPGLPGWGAKSSAAVLAKYVHLELIPPDWREWRVNAANAGALALTFSLERERAFLFRTLATLETGIPLFLDVDELQWDGPKPAFEQLGARLDSATAVKQSNVVKQNHATEQSNVVKQSTHAGRRRTNKS